jgi:hypothetical protein
MAGSAIYHKKNASNRQQPHLDLDYNIWCMKELSPITLSRSGADGLRMESKSDRDGWVGSLFPRGNVLWRY